MNTRIQLLCAWSGLAFALIFMLGFALLAQFVPPPSPNAVAAEVAARYREATAGIRFGALLMMISAGFIGPFVAVICIQIRRMEGTPPILAHTQLACGTIGIAFFILPALAWTAAAFRPDRDAQLVLLLNDLGWLTFLMPFGTFVVQNIAIGLAILGDRGSPTLFPRWVAFFTLWVAVLLIPGGLLTFFKTGPFAWDGLFAFWVPLVVFFAWYLVVVWFLRRAILAGAAAPAP